MTSAPSAAAPTVTPPAVAVSVIAPPWPPVPVAPVAVLLPPIAMADWKKLRLVPVTSMAAASPGTNAAELPPPGLKPLALMLGCDVFCSVEPLPEVVKAMPLPIATAPPAAMVTAPPLPPVLLLRPPTATMPPLMVTAPEVMIETGPASVGGAGEGVPVKVAPAVLMLDEANSDAAERSSDAARKLPLSATALASRW